MPLNERNYALLEWAKSKERGILVPTLPEPPSFLQITTDDQIVVSSMCSDGRKLEDQLGHQWSIHEKVCGHRHTHLVANAGGPICISPEQGMVDAFPDEYGGAFTKSLHDLRQLAIGCRAMNTTCVELVCHAPCALAEMAGLDLFDIIRSTVNAIPLVIDFLKQSKLVQPIIERSGLQPRVDCYLHADQLTQFKTRAINPDSFRKHHDEFEALAQRYRTHGVSMAMTQ